MSIQRFLALICLVLQNSALILFTRISYREKARVYNKATVVLTAEVLKLLLCLIVEFHVQGYSFKRVTRSLKPSLPKVSMAIPASLYVLQNFLQLRALQGLPSGLFATMSQLKIPSSAIFSFIILGQKLKKTQLVSIPLLVTGVMIAQVKEQSRKLTQPVLLETYFSSISALFIAVTISGFAGTLLELSYKHQGNTLWVKNVYLSMFSLPTAVMMVGGTNLFSVEVFKGYDIFVVVMVILLAGGGLLTAIVMKHAGNLTKCYAVSLSIVICNVVSFTSDRQEIDYASLLSALLVIFAVILYAI